MEKLGSKRSIHSFIAGLLACFCYGYDIRIIRFSGYAGKSGGS